MTSDLLIENLNKQREELSFDYSEGLKTKEEKTVEEIRRRNQAYVALDYMLSNLSYYDFFVEDAIRIVKSSHYISKECEAEFISSEFLLLGYLSVIDKNLLDILKKYNLTKKGVGSFITKSNSIIKQSFFVKNKIIFQEKLLNLVEVIFGSGEILTEKEKNNSIENLNCSNEVETLFEKAAENAIMRFKTPVINPDILFITMMEEKNTKSYKIIKNFVSNEMDWYLLRFELLKRLHRKESLLRSDVKINHRYFAYLLNIQYLDVELDKIFKNNLLSENVLLFRNRLVKNTLSQNIFHYLANDIHESIEMTTNRVYKYY